MVEGRRVNFAYVGGPSAEWTELVERSARVRTLAGEPDEGDDNIVAEAKPRPAGPPRQLPQFRAVPNQDTPVLAAPDLLVRFDTTARLDVQFTGVRVYESGVAFRLIAIDRSQQELADDGRHPNLGSRIKPNQPHRVKLVVDLPGGTLLSNSTKPTDFPDDPTLPWLAGGTSYSRRIEQGIESGAEYFVSPVPSAGSMVVTVAYPEFGVEMTHVSIDTGLFAEP